MPAMTEASHHLPRLLTAQEVAKATGLPLHRVYELARRGALPHVRLGRSLRFSAQSLLAWIDRGGSTD